MDGRDAATAGLLAATAALFAVYGRDPWILWVGLGLVAFLLVGRVVFRLLARELDVGAGPKRRLLRHKGLMVSGLVASGASCLLAAALVTRHTQAHWGLLYWFLALLMTAGIAAIRVAYHGGRRIHDDGGPEPI